MRVFMVMVVAALVALTAATPATGSLDARMPPYQHIFVIVEENKNYEEIVGGGSAPALSALAREYGNATQYYAVTHPSEPNYVAIVGGDTYGIQDDDAFYCTPHMRDPGCPHSNDPGYVNHTIDAPSVATQLQAAHLTWKAYLESIPSPGSLVHATALYTAKHSGFMNFLSVQRDPHRSWHFVGFGQLAADLRANAMPNLALIVPNICNEMHGRFPGPETPPGCAYLPEDALIARGDEHAAAIVRAITSAPLWRSSQNVAIVITFDENDDYTYAGCCGNDPSDPSNRGGGHIPTIVVTNHGPRGVADPTPYSHYSLLRTIEDAFGIRAHLKRANADGVVPMQPLFRTALAR